MACASVQSHDTIARSFQYEACCEEKLLSPILKDQRPPRCVYVSQSAVIGFMSSFATRFVSDFVHLK